MLGDCFIAFKKDLIAVDRYVQNGCILHRHSCLVATKFRFNIGSTLTFIDRSSFLKCLVEIAPN